MNKSTIAVGAAAGLIFSLAAQATPVDLSGWTAEGGASTWTVQSGNDSVLQTVNGDPTVFFDPTSTSTQGTALNGKIKVNESGGDDDYIGFVLGYQTGEITSSTADFFMVDWKQGDQTFSGSFAPKGLAISHVSDADTIFPDFWNHSGGVTEIARGANLGSTGWADVTEYSFNIVFTSTLIQVSVGGVGEISITPGDVAGVSSFGDGAFGFYNYSQAQVLYSAIQQIDCDTTPDAPECQEVPVPEPHTFALAAFALAGLVRRGRAGKHDRGTR